MNLPQHQQNPFIKSWVGLSLGLLFVGLSGYAWLDSREASSLIAGWAFYALPTPGASSLHSKILRPCPSQSQ